jgi:hypothetical protein
VTDKSFESGTEVDLRQRLLRYWLLLKPPFCSGVAPGGATDSRYTCSKFTSRSALALLATNSVVSDALFSGCSCGNARTKKSSSAQGWLLNRNKHLGQLLRGMKKHCCSIDCPLFRWTVRSKQHSLSAFQPEQVTMNDVAGLPEC